MQEKQRTLKQSYTFSGKGLHTGLHVTMNVIPAAENHGIKFKRTDLEGAPVMEALADYVTSTARGTTLEKGDMKISTIEHILSALSGMGIDNALIEIDAPEAPILDGSSKFYADAFLKDGFQMQDAKRDYFVVKEKIYYKDENSGAEITILPDDGFSIDLMIDFKSKVLGHQYARFDSKTDYVSEIAPCRTFVFFHELEPLFKNNLIKGGDLQNAIVIVENPVPQDELDRLANLFHTEKLERVPSGYLNHLELRFSNECARHKLLDVIGDFALIGFPIKGKIIANKSGHHINTTVAKIIRKMASENLKNASIPKYNPDAEPLIDINGIKKLLPHRPPFLMVDRIIEKTSDTIVGIKTIGINEGFFIGHFPDEPVMPGVLIVEAMAQVGGILVLADVDEPERYSTYFAKIDGVKFKKKVVPGDVLVIKMVLNGPIRRSLVTMRGEVYVGNTLVSEGDFVAQVIKNK